MRLRARDADSVPVGYGCWSSCILSLSVKPANAWRRLLVGTAFEREQKLLGGFEALCGVPGDHLEQDLFSSQPGMFGR